MTSGPTRDVAPPGCSRPPHDSRTAEAGPVSPRLSRASLRTPRPSRPEDHGMTPEEIGARVVEVLGGEGCSASLSAGGGAYTRATVDVPPDRWAEAARTARDELGCDFFDWLSAVDELPGGFTVVAHLWSTVRHHGVLLRTALTREAPTVTTLIDVYAGAA